MYTTAPLQPILEVMDVFLPNDVDLPYIVAASRSWLMSLDENRRKYSHRYGIIAASPN
jgi:hypothetical protein